MFVYWCDSYFAYVEKSVFQWDGDLLTYEGVYLILLRFLDYLLIRFTYLSIKCLVLSLKICFFVLRVGVTIFSLFMFSLLIKK